MNIDEDLKQLWLRQETPTPPSERELAQKALALKHRARNKVILSILIMLGTIVFISRIVWLSKPHLSTTYIGTALTILAITMHVVTTGSLMSFLFRPGPEDMNTRTYLELLIRIRGRQKFLQTRILSLYSILLMAGIFLYMVEYVLRMNTGGRILAYGVTGLWFAFVWFYLRPRTIRKESAKLDAVIGQLEKVFDQFS